MDHPRRDPAYTRYRYYYIHRGYPLHLYRFPYPRISPPFTGPNEKILHRIRYDRMLCDTCIDGLSMSGGAFEYHNLDVRNTYRWFSVLDIAIRTFYVGD